MLHIKKIALYDMHIGSP